MFNKKALALSILIFTGCATQEPFKISTVDGRFDENNKSTVISENNKLSNKTIAGGIYYDKKGIYINPSITRNVSGDNSIYLNLLHITETNSVSGTANVLGTPQKVIFLINGKPISITLNDAKSKFGSVYYNSTNKIATTPVVESGTGYISQDDYAIITNGKIDAVKITGSLTSATFESEDLLPTFTVNLKSFLLETNPKQ